MTDPQFTVAPHAGQHVGETVAAEPDDILEAQVAAHAIALGAEAVGHETPLGPIAGQVPGAAAQLQAAVQAGAVQAQNTAPAASATVSTYDDKPEQTSALVTPEVDAAPVEEAKPDPEQTPEPAHEPEAAHTEPAIHDADPGADDAA